MPAIEGSAEHGGAWRCVTCGERFRSRREVRGHWARFDVGHSVFRHLRTGRVHHQTVEGLFERDWEVAEPDCQAAGDHSPTDVPK